MHLPVDIRPQPVAMSREREAPHAYDFAGPPSGSRPVWCVIATYAQAERRAHAALHRFGFEAYLPLITVRRPDRHYHTGPLFPGYCFVRLRLDRPWHPVINCPGVFSLLSIDGKPSICPDHAIAAIQDALHAVEAFPAPSQRWKPGTPCSLATGPLKGMPAVVLSVHRETARIAVMMFGALREISLDVDRLSPCDE